MKTIIGLQVSEEMTEKFIIYCKICNDPKENIKGLILDRFEKHKEKKGIFRLTFYSFENVIGFFYGLGRVVDLDFTDSLQFHNN